MIVMFKLSSILKQKGNSLALHILIVCCISIVGMVMLMSQVNTVLESDMKLFGWIGNLLILWCLISWKYLCGRIFTPYVMFLLSFYVYLYGQAFLKSIGVPFKGFNLYLEFNNNQMLEAQIYTCICLGFLHLGALLSYKEPKKITGFVENKHNDDMLMRIVKRTSIVLILISFYPYLSNLIASVKNSLQNGYSSLYEIGNSSGGVSNILQSMSMFFIPGVFLLLICYREKRIIRILIGVIIIFIVLTGFISGGRGAAISLLVAFTWLWHTQIKPFKGWKFNSLIVIGLVIFSFFPVMSEFRLYADRSFSSFFDLYIKSIIEGNLIASGIGELGGSMFPLVKVMDLMPEVYSFRLGESYFAAIMAIIPSTLLGGYSFADLADLSNWLMNALQMDYGPGFSLVAESYYNLGWFGLLFMLILGYLFGKLLTPNSINTAKFIVGNTFVAITLYILINNVRGSLSLAVRSEFYMVIIPYCVIMLIYNSNKNKKKFLGNE